MTITITDPAAVPNEYLDVVMTVTATAYDAAWEKLPALDLVPSEKAVVTNHARIRAALDRPCETCGGMGTVWHESKVKVMPRSDTCPTCNGTGYPVIPGVTVE